MTKDKVFDDIWRQSKLNICPWWILAAKDAIEIGNYFLIKNRKNENIYLARFWLSRIKLDSDGGINSGDSCLLHWILKDDDEEALHDHPWGFRTQILNGGYTEYMPSDIWQNKYYGWGEKISGGPQPTGKIAERIVGNVVYKKSNDLHRAVNVLPNTWTLVTTSAKDRMWGFWPHNEKWQYYKDYLEIIK